MSERFRQATPLVKKRNDSGALSQQQCDDASGNCSTEVMMNEDVFNTSIRKFLKRLGVTAQREIEKAVRQGLAEGKLKGNEKLPAEATLTLGGIGLSLDIKGEIDLDE